MIDQQAVQTRPSWVPLIVGFGGGVNSAAVLVGLLARGIRPGLVVFADTGGEKPETYAFLDQLCCWLVEVGFPALTKVKKASPRVGDASLEDECLRRETLPSRAYGLSSCAFRWKIEPMEKHLNHWPRAVNSIRHGIKPIKALGYDAGESHRSAIEEDEKLRYWYPLREWGWDRERCVAEIGKTTLPLPPKSACFFCPSSRKEEVVQLQRQHPDLLARALLIEKTALESKRHEMRTIKGLGRHFAWSSLVSATPEERAKIPQAPGDSCTICTEGDDE